MKTTASTRLELASVAAFVSANAEEIAKLVPTKTLSNNALQLAVRLASHLNIKEDTLPHEMFVGMTAYTLCSMVDATQEDRIDFIQAVASAKADLMKSYCKVTDQIPTLYDFVK